MTYRHLATLLVVGLTGSACSGDDSSSTGGDDPQLPPDNGAAVTTWIAAGYYKSWQCEPAGHAARAPSPHGRNRICNNDALKSASGSGAYPIGAASAKELLDANDQITGYAVYRKLATGADGSNWYWYEVAGGDVVADGNGSTGAPKTICVDCHSHAPRDFVFTAVQ